MPYISGNKSVARDNRAAASPAGRENQQEGVPRPVQFREAQYIGAEKSVTSITRSGSTATITATAHGLAPGNIVRIIGADQPEYNGEHKVLTTADANTATFTVYGAPASATGTVTLHRIHQESVGD